MAQSRRYSRFYSWSVILAVVFSVATTQETFSQRRAKYLEEKRRIEAEKRWAEEDRLGIPTTTTTTTTTTTPKPYHELTPYEKLDVANRNIAKGDEAEFMAKLSQHMNWEQFLTPIPISLGVLGSLMMSATQTNDFTINDHKPVGGFQYMRHPTSFRQSLMQIGHESYKAFLVAHGNMNKIRLSTLTVPSYMNEATRILATGNFTVIQSRLHRPLRVVRTAINDSLNWSLKVANQFEYLSNLTDEVHLAAVSSKSAKEGTKLSVVEEQSLKKLTSDSVQQHLNQIEKQLKDNLKKSDRAHEDLLQAWLSKPTAFERLGMDIGQFFLNDVLGGLFGLFSSGKNSWNKPPTNEENNSASASNSSYNDPCIPIHSKLVFELDATGQTISTNYPTLEYISSSKGRYNATTHSDYFGAALKNVTNCQPIIDAIGTGQKYVESMHKLAHKTPTPLPKTSLKSDQETALSSFEEEREKEFSRIKKLEKSFISQCLQLKEMAQKVPTTNISPIVASEIPNESRASRQAMAMANYKIKLHTKSLEELRNNLDKNWKLAINKTEELVRILQEMSVLKTEEIQFEKAIKMLHMGLTQLSELKENWSNLVRFFVSISSVIESIGNKHLEDFSKDIETTSQSVRNIHKMCVINGIHVKATRANQATALVHGMADTYFKISTKYLMPNVHKLDRLMGLKPDKIPYERQLLVQSCERDSAEIGHLIVDGRLQLVEQVAARVRQVKNEYKFLDDLRERAKEKERTKIAEEKKNLVLIGQLPEEELQAEVEKEVKTTIEKDIFLSQDPIEEEEF